MPRRCVSTFAPSTRHAGRTTVAIATLLLIAAVGAPAAGPQEVGASTVTVSTEVEYRQALIDLSTDDSGPHTIHLGADLDLTGPTSPTYTGSQPLTIDGRGHQVHGSGARLIDHATIAPLTVQDVVVSGISNDGPGGLIASDATLTTLRRSSVAAATSQTSGGTLHALGDVLLDQVQVVNGTGLVSGGVVHVEGGGTTTIRASTFRGNNTGGIGAVVASDGPIDLLNSSTWHNQGHSILDAGNAPISISLSSLLDRVAFSNPVGVVVTTGTFSSFGSIAGRTIGVGPTCAVGATSSTYSSEGVGDSCGFTGEGDLTGVGGAIEPPAANGGPTETMRIFPDEPWTDAIPRSACEAFGVLVDQRGEPRPGVGAGACDMGSFEIQGNVALSPGPASPSPAAIEGPVAGRPAFTG